jgi:hypothetical protein
MQLQCRSSTPGWGRHRGQVLSSLLDPVHVRLREFWVTADHGAYVFAYGFVEHEERKWWWEDHFKNENENENVQYEVQ